MGEPLGRGVGAVGGGESVVDIEVAELGELGDIGRIVLLLALVEAGVFQQQHVAVLHFGDRVGGRLANAVGRKGDRALDDVGDRRSDGPERIGFVRTALRPAKMRKKDHLAAFAGDFLDGRRDALDAGRIRHAPVFGRNVEVDAQQDSLAGDVGVVEGAEWIAHVRLPVKVSPIGSSLRPSSRRSSRRRLIVVMHHAMADQISLAIATAVSAMRCAKPHSLSYQESTRTNVPSTTLV